MTAGSAFDSDTALRLPRLQAHHVESFISSKTGANQDMPHALQAPIAIAGRLLLAAIFLISPLVNLIPNFGSTVESMRVAGVLAPSVLLAVATAMLIVGSLSLITGYKARWGAVLLILFLLPATYYFHAPWKAVSAAEAGQQVIHFLKNIGLMGAMLLVIAVGPGPGSIGEARL
jgi:putative oxidoreductase